ncbi:hypothetical protein A3762_02550 [Oleiphilus sp. HI0125]|uniref:hypothetical protein n=1 Tax=Oleiphilus sp. HI0125 TaxID=1822266 RepID=UPI0007C3CA98|nr:hypothetical protein [Oleiphilus sp. HI0125]KZZ60783.1 hypothetical protein A3762_02550 [Oleiphilus sp. HI0125]
MKNWRDVVQAQMLFAGRYEKQIAAMNNVSSADRKLIYNGYLMSLSTAWQAWLNEWSELLSPKNKVNTIQSWSEFLSIYSNVASVSAFVERSRGRESWEAGFIDLDNFDQREVLVCVDAWVLADKKTAEAAQNDGLMGDLSVTQIDVRALSLKMGVADASQMFGELKRFISDVREQYAEY